MDVEDMDPTGSGAMDETDRNLHYSDMTESANPIPAYDLFGEREAFPDLMHCERIIDRATALDWRIPPHRHGVLHQFFHLAQPGARVTVDGKEIALERPGVLSVPRFHVHAFTFPRNQRGHVLSVRPDTLPELFGSSAELPGALSTWRFVDVEPSLAAAFEDIRRELMGNAPLRAALLKAKVIEIAAAVLRSDTTGLSAGQTRPGMRHMRRFEALVQETFTMRRGVAWYAEALGISPEHLGRITRTHAGASPGRFIERLVIREARRQLAYARTPVAGIGYALGYDDPAYFSRVFRRHEGMSPSEFRRTRSGFSRDHDPSLPPSTPREAH